MSQNILFMVGSLRANSASRALAGALAKAMPEGVSVTLANIGALPHYNADLSNDPHVETIVEQVRSADGVVLITPEYNYSVPGVLKNAIDWVSRPAYQSAFLHKPCFVISTSGGAMGGVRAQSHLKYILNGMVAHVFPSQEVIVPFGNDKVVDGVFTHEPTLDFAHARLADFCDFAWRGKFVD